MKRLSEFATDAAHLADERPATFIGLNTGAVDLTAPIPNTPKIGGWRIEPTGACVLMGLMDDPVAPAK